MQHWKTTAMGILTILGVLVNAALAHLHGQPVNMSVTFAGIMTGIGLIKAADAPKLNPPKG